MSCVRLSLVSNVSPPHTHTPLGHHPHTHTPLGHQFLHHPVVTFSPTIATPVSLWWGTNTEPTPHKMGRNRNHGILN